MLWLFFLTPIIIITFIFYHASVGGFGDMPDLEVLENPKTNLASEVITSDGKTLGKYYLQLYSLFLFTIKCSDALIGGQISNQCLPLKWHQ